MNHDTTKIRSFRDIDRIANERGPKKLAVLAPEDEEFMNAIKQCSQRGIVKPVLIGNRERIERVAEAVAFDISGVETIFEDDRQAIANLGTTLCFTGEVDIACKGQLPTAFVYRSIIRENARAGGSRTINVISLWEIPKLNRLIALTDTGVNIKPNGQAKVEILKSAVSFFHLFGYPKPRIAALTGKRGIDGTLTSYRDLMELREAAASGDLGICEILEETSFSEIFLGKTEPLINFDDVVLEMLPDIILIPHLDAGNILVKLDFFLDVIRRSLVMTVRGPVIIPSRSDSCDRIIGELALGVVAADRIKGGAA
jgi:phosphate butyryltransferase